MNKLDDMTFSYNAAYAAMCCWEEIASPVLKGAIVTLKGRLENVRWGRRDGACLVLNFADWSMATVNVVDDPTAKAIRIPLSRYVTVKARVIDEDGTLEAISIWEPGGVPIPLAKLSGDPTERTDP